MRLQDMRWATDPPETIRFDPHLTILVDSPRPDGGFAGYDSVSEMLAALAAVTPGEINGVSLDAAVATSGVGVAHLGPDDLRTAYRSVHDQRAQNSRDMLRVELAVTRADADGNRQQADERHRERERELAELRSADGSAEDEREALRERCESGTHERGPIEAAAAEVERIEMTEPVVPEPGTVVLIDRWLDLTTSIAFLGESVTAVTTFGEAARVLAHSRPAEERAEMGQIGPEEAEELHALHHEADLAEQHAASAMAGRGARRVLAQAREAEAEALARVGFGDYTEYLMSVAFNTEASTLEQAEASATRVARERVAAGDAVQLADDERWSELERELEELRATVAGFLGDEPSGDPHEALRGRVVTNPELVEARAALADALAHAGVEIADHEQALDGARTWLEEDLEATQRLEEECAAADRSADEHRDAVASQIRSVEAEVAVLAESLSAATAQVLDLDRQLAALDAEEDLDPGDVTMMDPVDVADVLDELLPSRGAISADTAPVVFDSALDLLSTSALPATFEYLVREGEFRQIVVVASPDFAAFADDWLAAREGARGLVWTYSEPEPDPEPEIERGADPDSISGGVEDADPELEIDLEPEPVLEQVAFYVEAESEEAEPEPEPEPDLVAVAEPEPEQPPETLTADADEGQGTVPPPDPEVPGMPCIRHQHRHSSTRCSRCGGPFCDDCLVQVGSGSRPRTLCVDCALLAGGVRVSRRRRARQRRRRR